jgi:hypothetical protein
LDTILIAIAITIAIAIRWKEELFISDAAMEFPPFEVSLP